MKAKRKAEEASARIQETATVPDGLVITTPAEPGMVRTQIYLTAREHAFLQRQAARCGETMASLIRRYIDEKMDLPEDLWTNNPLLEPPVHDPAFVGHEDDSINLDHYLYGTPKRYKKVRGKWVPVAPQA
ncbi:MAG: hypothetical protein QOE70_4868 [Chthoniobacter sp.]|jgi:hypothetical protein|nr:hypothetical protein [Chthoniobacter sp.]